MLIIDFFGEEIEKNSPNGSGVPMLAVCQNVNDVQFLEKTFNWYVDTEEGYSAGLFFFDEIWGGIRRLNANIPQLIKELKELEGGDKNEEKGR